MTNHIMFHTPGLLLAIEQKLHETKDQEFVVLDHFQLSANITLTVLKLL